MIRIIAPTDGFTVLARYIVVGSLWCPYVQLLAILSTVLHRVNWPFGRHRKVLRIVFTFTTAANNYEQVNYYKFSTYLCVFGHQLIDGEVSDCC
jgi:hypothetical protein